MNLELIEHASEIRRILKRAKAIEGNPDNKADGYYTPAAEASLSELNLKLKYITVSKIEPAWLRTGLVSISGMEIDGEAATVETLLEYDEHGLIEEILKALQRSVEHSELEVPGPAVA